MNESIIVVSQIPQNIQILRAFQPRPEIDLPYNTPILIQKCRQILQIHPVEFDEFSFMPQQHTPRKSPDYII